MTLVLTLQAATERAWTDIPAVRIVGIIIGITLIIAAIRAMFAKK